MHNTCSTSLSFVVRLLIFVACVLGIFSLSRTVRADGKLKLTVVDQKTKKPIACRMHLKNEQGKPRKVGRHPFWHDHIVIPGEVVLKLPAGKYTFEIERGPEYVVRRGEFTMHPAGDDHQTAELQRFIDMKTEGWWSGEMHVHRPLKDLPLLMEAEDLHVAPVITWWNDKSEWTKKSLPDKLLHQVGDDRFYHLMAGEDERGGGALLYFNLLKPLSIAQSEREYPSSLKFLEQAKKEHPQVWVDAEKPFWWDFPLWVASGKIDSVGIANNHMQRGGMYPNEAWGKPRDLKRFPNPKGNGEWTQEIYYHLLNCGLRIPPSAGSASGVLPNPVGYNRAYVFLGEEFSYDAWWEGMRKGRVMVTNGPLIRSAIEGKMPGHVFQAQAGETLSLNLLVSVASRDPMSYWEVIKDGQAERIVRLDRETAALTQKPLEFTESGWFLIRAVTNNPDTYRFASTAPYYVEIGDAPKKISKASVEFFQKWVQEREKMLRETLRDPAQRDEVLTYVDHAKKFWSNLHAQANAE